jgi:hypothetical protein
LRLVVEGYDRLVSVWSLFNAVPRPSKWHELQLPLPRNKS